jgi:hypothetical protein
MLMKEWFENTALDIALKGVPIKIEVDGKSLFGLKLSKFHLWEEADGRVRAGHYYLDTNGAAYRTFQERKAAIEYSDLLLQYIATEC